MTRRFYLKQSSHISFYHYQIQLIAEEAKVVLDLTKKKRVGNKFIPIEEDEKEEVVITLYQLQTAQKKIDELKRTLKFHGVKEKDAYKKFL